MNSEPKTGGVKAVRQQLDEKMNIGDFYHAQQLYKTLVVRYTAKKRYIAMQELLIEGAVAMLNKDQIPAGTELASLLIKHLTEQKVKCTAQVAEPLLSIFRAYPEALDPSKKSFVVAVCE
eukprot:TRINITY_DN4103_c0_g1_i1.p1 TRINITY_DN4103_c0_g1~~TRINITY_DN4103_c0_g1_i1.p1  ORF type:complete len:135 (-),score=27.55 TRINITY_DN4103_c0_g1_i1:623-982(-)